MQRKSYATRSAGSFLPADAPLRSPVKQGAMTSLSSVSPRPAVRRLAAVAALGFAVAALAVSPAVAARHIGLASSTPAKDSHITTAPTEIRLTFTGRIDVKTAGIELIAPDSSKVAVDSLRAVPDSNRVAVSKINGKLKGGTYTVRWNAIAADGAAGKGSFTFMYMAPADTK